MTEYLRPDGDVALDGWTDQAGGTTNIYQSLDEEGGGWSPADLTGLVGWYNFDEEGVTFTKTGSNVTTVVDLSGNGHTLTPTGGNVPYHATAFNGFPCANFAEGNTAALINASFAMGTGKLWTVYIAGTMESATDDGASALGYARTGGFNDFNDSGGALFFYKTATNTVGGYRDGTGGATMAMSEDTPHRFGSIARDAGGGTYSFFRIVDGVAGSGTSETASFLSGGNLIVGARYSSSVGDPHWDGPMAEVVICNVDIGDTDLALLDAYYVEKYGLGATRVEQFSVADTDFVQSPAVVGSNVLKVRLFDGVTQIVEWTHTGIADTFTDAVQTLTAPQVAAISNFANLFVEFDDNQGNVYRFALGDPPGGLASPVEVKYRYKKLAV